MSKVLIKWGSVTAEISSSSKAVFINYEFFIIRNLKILHNEINCNIPFEDMIQEGCLSVFDDNHMCFNFGNLFIVKSLGSYTIRKILSDWGYVTTKLLFRLSDKIVSEINETDDLYNKLNIFMKRINENDESVEHHWPRPMIKSARN